MSKIDIQKKIEKIMEKYYFEFNTPEIRKAVTDEINFVLKDEIANGETPEFEDIQSQTNEEGQLIIRFTTK